MISVAKYLNDIKFKTAQVILMNLSSNKMEFIEKANKIIKNFEEILNELIKINR